MIFSIIINNYNYAHFLRNAVDSALAQTELDREVLVVDDGSTDDSLGILAEYGDRIKVIVKENGGQASAFNAGFKASVGEWILFLDADDLLLPEALNILKNRDSFRDLEVISFQWRLWSVDANGEKMLPALPTPKRLHGGDPKITLLSGGHYGASPTSGNLFRREVLEDILPMPEEPYRICADLYLQISIPFFGRIEWVDEPLGFYRIHGDNHYAGRKKRKELWRFKRDLGLQHAKHERIHELADRFDCQLHAGFRACEIQYLPFTLLLQRLESDGARFSLRLMLLREVFSGLGILSKAKGFPSAFKTLARVLVYSALPLCLIKKLHARTN